MVIEIVEIIWVMIKKNLYKENSYMDEIDQEYMMTNGTKFNNQIFFKEIMSKSLNWNFNQNYIMIISQEKNHE